MRIWPLLLIGLAGCHSATDPGPESVPSRPPPEPGHRLHTSLRAVCEDPLPAEGRLIFSSNYRSPDFNLYVKPPDGLPVSFLTTDPADEREPALHPDGRQIAFSSNAAGTWDLWLAPLDDPARERWTLIAGTDDWEAHPSWSPDGSALAWCALSRADGTWLLRVRDSAGSVRDLGEGFAPEWSPDGTRLACQRARASSDRRWSLTIVEAATGSTRDLTPDSDAGAITPAWSPDGKWVVFATASPDVKALPEDLWAVSVADGKRVRLTSGAASEWNPVFGADGRIYYCRQEAAAVEIWSMESPLN